VQRPSPGNDPGRLGSLWEGHGSQPVEAGSAERSRAQPDSQAKVALAGCGPQSVLPEGEDTLQVGPSYSSPPVLVLADETTEEIRGRYGALVTLGLVHDI